MMMSFRRRLVALCLISLFMFCIPAYAVTYQDYPYNQPADIYVVDAYGFYNVSVLAMWHGV